MLDSSVYKAAVQKAALVDGAVVKVTVAGQLWWQLLRGLWWQLLRGL